MDKQDDDNTGEGANANLAKNDEWKSWKIHISEWGEGGEIKIISFPFTSSLATNPLTNFNFVGNIWKGNFVILYMGVTEIL